MRMRVGKWEMRNERQERCVCVCVFAKLKCENGTRELPQHPPHPPPPCPICNFVSVCVSLYVVEYFFSLLNSIFRALGGHEKENSASRVCVGALAGLVERSIQCFTFQLVGLLMRQTWNSNSKLELVKHPKIEREEPVIFPKIQSVKKKQSAICHAMGWVLIKCGN